MSLATLKKKTLAKYNNSSVQQRQFSINGTYRNQGYVGQSSLSRSLPKNGSQGYGGCCGSYLPVKPILSAVTSTEDNTFVKSSVLSTSGMLAKRYRWIKRGYPFSSLKPGNDMQGTSSAYTEFKKKETLRDVYLNTSSCNTNSRADKCCNLNITQPEKDIVAMSQSEYILQLHKQCADLDISYIQYSSSVNRAPINVCG
jgi:hypothetical protein